MSQINLKSITGITSITTPGGVDDVFTVHSNDTTERFRVDSNGNQVIAGILTVTQDSVIVTFNGRTAPTRFSRATQQSEWDALNSSMKDVDLSKVSSLEAPSNKRAMDAAPFAKIVFIGKDSTITSADFDAKNPHEMLKPLEKQFLEIQEENKR